MRNQIINERQYHVLNYKGKEKVVDSNGDFTGEEIITYTKPIAFMGHISGAKGSSQVEIFGTDVAYDKTIILTTQEFNKLKINENSVFFIEKKPTFSGETPLYDYRVSRIAETINEVAIAVKRVEQ